MCSLPSFQHFSIFVSSIYYQCFLPPSLPPSFLPSCLPFLPSILFLLFLIFRNNQESYVFSLWNVSPENLSLTPCPLANLIPVADIIGTLPISFQPSQFQCTLTQLPKAARTCISAHGLALDARVCTVQI